MKKKFLVLLVMGLFSLGIFAKALQAQDSETRRYIKAFYPDKPSAHLVIKTFEPEPPEVNYDEGFIVMHVTDEDIVYLKSMDFTVQEYPAYRIDNTRDDIVREDLRSIPGYSCYETVEETFSEATSITTEYPNLAQLVDAGNSWKKKNGSGGYDMLVLKLTNSAISGKKPDLFITTALHAREYATAPLSLAFAKYLVENYQTNADARWILDHNEIHLMLQSNPDGRKKAEAGSSWRKNVNTTICSNGSKKGVDLNRNFAYKWGGVGASSSECSETFRGESAASEPETKAIQNYMKSIFDDHNGSSISNGAPLDSPGLYIDIHSYSELVLWPPGYTSNSVANTKQLQTLGRKFAFFNGYTPQKGADLYPTTGTTDDYAYGELGVAAYCFELGTAFFQNCNTYNNKILPDNLEALIYAAKVARAPYMTPAGPDALSLSINGSNKLTATMNDKRYNNSNGTESTQTISAAEYYIDTPPWANGSAKAMAANDGSFNSKTEVASATINTSTLSQGQHTIFVRGKDSGGNWGAVSAIFINVGQQQTQAPTSNFTYTVSQLQATFTDISSDTDGTIQSWQWNFGDGTTSTQQNPVHTYTTSETYTVTLTVTDNDGETGSFSTEINLKLLANFTFSNTLLEVNFTDQSTCSTGSIQSWNWNFGDGDTSTEPSPVHTYTKTGDYNVTLEIRNNSGESAEITKKASLSDSDTNPFGCFINSL